MLPVSKHFSQHIEVLQLASPDYIVRDVMKNPIKSLRQNPTFNFWFSILLIAVGPLYLWAAWGSFAAERSIQAILSSCSAVLFPLMGILALLAAKRRRST